MAIAAIGQLCSTASMSHNLALCQALAKKAVEAGAKALFLPEAALHRTTLLPVRKNPSPLLGPWKAAHSSSVSKPLQRTTT